MEKAECMAALRNMYDGYHFAPLTEGVYNPDPVPLLYQTGYLTIYNYRPPAHHLPDRIRREEAH